MLENYRVDYREYKNIEEPKIYVWYELGTGRTIGRIFNTGEAAENSRSYYSTKTQQQISWCKGVFPIDMDREQIRDVYPDIEFQDDLIEEGRKGRGKDKKPRIRRTKKEIQQERNCTIKINPQIYLYMSGKYGDVDSHINEILKEEIKRDMEMI